MASNFAFHPFGQSVQITVGGGAPATVSLAVVSGTNVTASLTSGNYQPSSVRIVNEGTASAFLMFHSTTGATATVSTLYGAKVMGNTSAVFDCRGQPVIAAVCASTFTVTLTATPGEVVS